MENTEIREALEGALLTEFTELADAKESHEKKEIVGRITPLYEMYLNDCKNVMAGLEEDRKEDQRVTNNKFELEKLEMENKKLAETKTDRNVKIALTVAEIGIPLIGYAVFLSRGFRFEETGAYRSKTMMNLMGKINPFKK